MTAPLSSEPPFTTAELVDRLRTTFGPFFMPYAADELDRLAARCAELERDAARYQYLRNTYFSRDADLPPNFTGDLIIAPPRAEEFKNGVSIMTYAAHHEHLDAVIDAALQEKP